MVCWRFKIFVYNKNSLDFNSCKIRTYIENENIEETHNQYITEKT